MNDCEKLISDEREAMRRIIAQGSYSMTPESLPYEDVAYRLVEAGFGFRRSEVPEPSAKNCRMCADSEGPEHSRACHFGEHTGCDRFAEGSDSMPCGCRCHEAKKPSHGESGHVPSYDCEGCYFEHEPQGEPSGAQVPLHVAIRAVDEALRSYGYPQSRQGAAEAAVTALRAASSVKN